MRQANRMRFQFRLQKMLQMVELRESAKKLEVATLLTELERLRTRQLKLREEVRDLLGKTIHSAQGLAWAPMQESQVKSHEYGIRQLTQQIETESERLEHTRYELNRIILNRRALESLREKRRAEFKKERFKREQKQAEETFRNFYRVAKK